MIRIGGKEISAIHIASKAVTAVYAGMKLVWQSVHSCFGSGAWNNDQPWDNDDAWNNG